MLRPLLWAGVFVCGVQGAGSMEVTQLLPLPNDPIVTDDTSVSVPIPASVPDTGYSLLVTVKPLVVGATNFVLQACPEANCRDIAEKSLATMAFFPPPVVGETRQFVVQVPAGTQKQDRLNELVFSVVPLVVRGAAVTEIELISIEVVE